MRKALLFFCLSIFLVSCRNTPSESEINLLKAQIQSGLKPAYVNDPMIWETTTRLYELRQFHPVWVARNRPVRVESLIAAVENSGRDGLDPEELGLKEIERELNTITSSDDTAQWMDFDIRLTYAAARLASELYFGRTDPSTIDRNWRAQKRTGDLAGLLNDTVSSDNMAELATRLEPSHPEYAALKNQLAHYREIAAGGGWPQLSRDLKTDESGNQIVRRILEVTGDLESTEEVTDGLKRFESRNGLKADGVLDSETTDALAIPVEERIVQIETNMDRWRLLPDFGERHVRVNIPAFELEVHDGKEVPIRMRVVVGSNENRTPVFSADMKYVVFSPYWNIPESIMTEETLPMAIKDPDYLRRQNIEIVRVSGEEAHVVDPSEVDWDRASEDFEYQLRQKPGASNALGLVKFMFPNSFNVYLHDTPADNLFDRLTRTLSHGCVRVEKPEELAGFVLRDQPEWTPERIRKAMHAGSETHVGLKEPLPVHLVYFTAWVDSGNRIQFRKDQYGYDQKQAKLIRHDNGT